MRCQNLLFVGACLKISPSTILFYLARNDIIVSETVLLVLQWFMQSKIGKRMFVVDFVHRSITFHIVFQEL